MRETIQTIFFLQKIPHNSWIHRWIEKVLPKGHIHVQEHCSLKFPCLDKSDRNRRHFIHAFSSGAVLRFHWATHRMSVCLSNCLPLDLRSRDQLISAQQVSTARCNVKGGAHTLGRWCAKTLDNHKSCLWIEQTCVWVAVALSVRLLGSQRSGSEIRCITERLWTGSKQIADDTLRATGLVHRLLNCQKWI